MLGVSFIFTIIGLMISLDVIWWIVFARLTNHATGRVVVSIFMVAMMVGLIVVIAARLSRADWDRFIPKFAVSAIFIWHFIGLGRSEEHTSELQSHLTLVCRLLLEKKQIQPSSASVR